MLAVILGLFVPPPPCRHPHPGKHLVLFSLVVPGFSGPLEWLRLSTTMLLTPNTFTNRRARPISPESLLLCNSCARVHVYCLCHHTYRRQRHVTHPFDSQQP